MIVSKATVGRNLAAFQSFRAFSSANGLPYWCVLMTMVRLERQKARLVVRLNLNGEKCGCGTWALRPAPFALDLDQVAVALMGYVIQ